MKKLRARWKVDPEQDRKFYDSYVEYCRKLENGEIDEDICPWTGEPHGWHQRLQ